MFILIIHYFIFVIISLKIKKNSEKNKNLQKHIFQDLFLEGGGAWTYGILNECLWWPSFLLLFLEGNILKMWKKWQKFGKIAFIFLKIEILT